MPTIHPLDELVQAHDGVLPLIQSIPNEAIDWTPSESEWSLRNVIGHLAHANDFYAMIVDEARRSNFSSVDLNQELAGKQQMRATDAAINAATTTAMLLEILERTFQRLIELLQTLTDQELDALFQITERANTRITTLRERVFQSAVFHFQEHMPQLSETLAQWQAEQKTAP